MEGFPDSNEADRPAAPEMLQQVAQRFDDPATYPKMQSTEHGLDEQGKLWYMAIDRQGSGLPILAPHSTRAGTLKVYSRQLPGDPELTEITWKSSDPGSIRVQYGDGDERPVQPSDEAWLREIYQQLLGQEDNPS